MGALHIVYFAGEGARATQKEFYPGEPANAEAGAERLWLFFVSQ